MKKIFLLISILLSISGAYAQHHILLQFSGQDKIPVISFDEAGKKYTVKSTDDLLTGIFNSFTITKFVKEYPHAHLVKHKNAEPLDRVYHIETSGDINSLYRQLQQLKTNALSGTIYLVQKPEILVEPNDYNLVVFNSVCVARTSRAQNDLINAPAAWDITTGDPNIRIGISDDNFYRTQEDLAAKINLDNAYPYYGGSSHGTAVAVLAGGNTNNGVGLASIGYNCKVDLYDLYSIDYVLDAAMNGARVVNCSWYNACSFIQTDQDMIDMIYETYHTVIVAAAGNGDNTCGSMEADVYPASYNHVISVSTVGHYISLAEFVNCPASYNVKDVHDKYPNSPLVQTHQHNANVDLCAPGYVVAIPNVSSSGNPPNSTYSGGTGSSFSAPMVAGTAALILSVNPLLGPDDVEAILKCSARDLYEIPYNVHHLNKLGWGRLDAGAAVQLAQTWVPGTGANQQPTPTDIRWFDILSDGINTIEVENTCNSDNYPGMCNIGYRLEVVSSNPGAVFKWLTLYSENGTNVTNSIKYGNSITLLRGIDYPATNVTGGSLKACVRINDCLPSIYYSEDRNADCFGSTQCNPCPSDITITGVYSTPVTESATWVKSSGQTTIDATLSVKLDAHPVNGFIEFAPATASDYLLSEPDVNGVFIVDPFNGCVTGTPSFTKGKNVNTITAGNVLESTTGNIITVYPNPGNGIFFAKHPAGIKQMVISDSQGKLLLKIDSRGSTLTKIDLSSMPNGIYMLRMEGVNKVMKIIKQ